MNELTFNSTLEHFLRICISYGKIIQKNFIKS